MVKLRDTRVTDDAMSYSHYGCGVAMLPEQVSKASTVLIDDDRNNIRVALEEGVSGVCLCDLPDPHHFSTKPCIVISKFHGPVLSGCSVGCLESGEGALDRPEPSG